MKTIIKTLLKILLTAIIWAMLLGDLLFVVASGLITPAIVLFFMANTGFYYPIGNLIFQIIWWAICILCIIGLYAIYFLLIVKIAINSMSCLVECFIWIWKLKGVKIDQKILNKPNFIKKILDHC